MHAPCLSMNSLPSAAEGAGRSGAGILAPTGLSTATNFTLLLAILVLALLSGEIARRNSNADAQARLDEMATHMVSRLSERMTLYQYGLRGLRASVQAVGIEHFSRAHFDRYSRARDIKSEFPGARGYGVIRRVPADKTAAFIAAARNDGRPAFEVHELTPNPNERWIVQYIDLVSNKLDAEGRDVASEPRRREAVENAVATGKTTLTQPIAFGQADAGTTTGFLLMSPIYRPGMPIDTPEARREAVFGLAFSPLEISEVLAKVDLDAKELSIALDSVSNAGQPKRFYETPAFGQSGRRLLTTRPINLFGVEWRLSIIPAPAFFVRLNHLAPGTVALLVFLALSSALLLANLYLLARRRRELLLGNQIRLAAIVESSNDAIIGKSVDGVVASWNPAAEAMFGYSAAEAIGHSIASLIVPAGLQEEERNILARLHQGDRISNFVTRRRRKDGSELEVSVSVSPIFDANGRIVGAAKTVHDVTEYQLALRQIRELNATLEHRVAERTTQLEDARNVLHTVLDAIPSMVALWDRNCINRFANRAYLEWFGVAPIDIHGKHIRTLLGDALYERNRSYIQKALQGEAQTFERDIPRPDGKGIRHSIAHYLPHVVDGAADGFYVIVHDITELIEGRNQLQEAREQQMRTDRLASLGLMVAGVAHELNTPLGAAMLALDKLTEELAQFKAALAAGLRKSDVQRLSGQFDDGLAMASRYLARGAEIIRQFKQVASDRAGAERRVFVVNEVVRDVTHLMDGQIRKHGVRLQFDMPTAIEMDSYPGIVGQVLQNLVENAVVHAFDVGAPGLIHIAMGAAQDAHAVQLTVSDNGKGIPDDIRERIWDPFFTTRRGEGGTGLGLHIVQRLVTELLGGSIVQGAPPQGHGCEFVVTIPLLAPTSSAS